MRSFLFFFFALSGCGSTHHVDGAFDGGPDASVDAPLNDAPPLDAPPIDAGTHDSDASADGGPFDAGPESEPCRERIRDLERLIYTPPQACTGVVRLDYATRAVLGWQLVCGGYGGVDETQARARAEADTGFGMSGTPLSGANPEDAWVFYESPSDFGGASVVSSDTGLSVFGGGIVWDGRGEITWPTSWRAGAEIGTGCQPQPPVPAPRGYDLRSGQPLSAADVDAALAVVARTALPAAFRSAGYLFHGVVLLYPRSVGAFDPASAEWIVLLSGGWLE